MKQRFGQLGGRAAVAGNARPDSVVFVHGEPLQEVNVDFAFHGHERADPHIRIGGEQLKGLQRDGLVLGHPKPHVRLLSMTSSHTATSASS